MRYHESKGIKAALVTVLVLSVSSLLVSAAHVDGTGGSAKTVRVGYVILKTIRRAAKANTSAALATRICSASPIRPVGSMNTSATPSASCCKSGRTARSTCSACCTATSGFRGSMVFSIRTRSCPRPLSCCIRTILRKKQRRRSLMQGTTPSSGARPRSCSPMRNM